MRCGDIKDFCIDIGGLKRVSQSIASKYPRTRLHGGEVLLAIRGTVGATAVTPPEMTGMNISREVALIPVLPGVDPNYVALLLASPSAQSLLGRHVKGVAQSGINLEDVRRLPVPFPSLREQKAIVDRVGVFLKSISGLQAVVDGASSRHTTLTQSILAKAFRGELVPQDPNDEPASVLLERIRAERAAAGEKPRRGRRSHAGA